MAGKPPKGRGTPGQGYPDREEPKHRPEGREHQVHREILERRMRGGSEPTPEAYRRALEQWKKLRGSKVRPPTDIVTPPDEQSGPGEEPEADEPGKPDPSER
jgi:hypothetical protein